MTPARWTFDVISPFAYLAFRRLRERPLPWQLDYRPVLFAGLLKHWGQKGPAEIPAKRLWTYRYCTWWAEAEGIPFQFPARHPFNPLPYLRLIVAAGHSADAVGTVMDALWTTGADAADAAAVRVLAERLGVDFDQLSQPAVKQTLQQHTDAAIAEGIFGVPTLSFGGEHFWGLDGLDFAFAVQSHPELLRSASMQRLSTLPIAASRL